MLKPIREHIATNQGLKNDGKIVSDAFEFYCEECKEVTLDYVLTDIEFREWLDDFYAAYIGIMPKNYFQYLNHSRVNTVLVDEDTLLLFINNDNEEGRN